jgi:hypothetical protein
MRTSGRGINIMVITPTLGRAYLVERLQKCLNTQNQCDHLNSAQHKVMEFDKPCWVVPHVNQSVDEAFSLGYDVVMYLADYCQPTPNMLNELSRHFYFAKDFDEVVDIPITNYPGAKRGCFWAIGIDYWKRFQGNGVWCPEYYHFFVDTELWERAASIGKVWHSKAGVEVDHPNLGTRHADKAHQASRVYRDFDNETYALRQKAGVLWGKDFKRIRSALPWPQ